MLDVTLFVILHVLDLVFIFRLLAVHMIQREGIDSHT